MFGHLREFGLVPRALGSPEGLQAGEDHGESGVLERCLSGLYMEGGLEGMKRGRESRGQLGEELGKKEGGLHKGGTVGREGGAGGRDALEAEQTGPETGWPWSGRGRKV